MYTVKIYGTPNCTKCRITKKQLLTSISPDKLSYLVLDTPEKIDNFKSSHALQGRVSSPFVEIYKDGHLEDTWNDMQVAKIEYYKTQFAKAH